MNNLDSPDYSRDHISQELELYLDSKKAKVLSDITTLLEHGCIEDEVDRGIVVGAVAFIENPSEEISAIMGQTKNIGQVLAGYMMSGADLPPEIDAIHGYLFALQCINKIKLIEAELLKESPDALVIQEAMARGSDWAITLSKGYNDDTFLNAFNDLMEGSDGPRISKASEEGVY